MSGKRQNRNKHRVEHANLLRWLDKEQPEPATFTKRDKSRAKQVKASRKRNR